jgi:hypothetical protein
MKTGPVSPDDRFFGKTDLSTVAKRFSTSFSCLAGFPSLAGFVTPGNCERESNGAEIDKIIYAQCVTYIGSEEGKILDHDVWTRGKTLRGWLQRPWWA